MTGLLDTNVALYLLGGRLAAPLPEGEHGVSVITEMEMLAWPSLTPEEEARVRAFLGNRTAGPHCKRPAHAGRDADHRRQAG